MSEAAEKWRALPLSTKREISQANRAGRLTTHRELYAVAAWQADQQIEAERARAGYLRTGAAVFGVIAVATGIRAATGHLTLAMVGVGLVLAMAVTIYRVRGTEERIFKLQGASHMATAGNPLPPKPAELHADDRAR